MYRAFGFITLFGSIAWLVIVPVVVAPKMGVQIDFKNGTTNGFIAIWLVGFALLFLCGAAVWAQSKGYYAELGALLGLTGPVGLLILTLLPDRTPKRESHAGPEYSCPNCGGVVHPNADGECKCPACQSTYRFSSLAQKES